MVTRGVTKFRGSSKFLVYELAAVDTINSDCRREVVWKHVTLYFLFLSPTKRARVDKRSDVVAPAGKSPCGGPTGDTTLSKRGKGECEVSRGGRRVWLTPSRLRGFGRHRVEGWKGRRTLCRPTAALFPVAINCLARPALPSFLPSFSPPSPADAPIAWLLDLPYRLPSTDPRCCNGKTPFNPGSTLGGFGLTAVVCAKKHVGAFYAGAAILSPLSRRFYSTLRLSYVKIKEQWQCTFAFYRGFPLAE